MPEDLFDEPEQRAAEMVTAARRFLARGKLRHALDALNLAIQLSPGNPEAFRERADVFERMGLAPQAEADRRRADELAAMLPPPPPPPPEPGESPQFPEAPEDLEQQWPETEAPAQTREPAYDYGPVPSDIPREPVEGSGLGKLLMTIAAIGVFSAAAIGAVAAALTLDGGGGSSPSASPFGTGVASGDASATPTLAPTAGSPSVTGSPYSLSDVVSAWKAKGMTVQTGSASAGFTGFKTVPLDVTMSRDGATATSSVFVYDTADEAQAEWGLVPGSRPAPKGDRAIPSHVSAWWNANVVVVLRTDSGGLGPDAFDGLINMGG